MTRLLDHAVHVDRLAQTVPQRAERLRLQQVGGRGQQQVGELDLDGRVGQHQVARALLDRAVHRRDRLLRALQRHQRLRRAALEVTHLQRRLPRDRRARTQHALHVEVRVATQRVHRQGSLRGDGDATGERRDAASPDAADVHVRRVVQRHAQNQLVHVALRAEAAHDQQRVRAAGQRRAQVDGGRLVHERVRVRYSSRHAPTPTHHLGGRLVVALALVHEGVLQRLAVHLGGVVDVVDLLLLHAVRVLRRRVLADERVHSLDALVCR